ncbi:hypothetical protein K438DRAFT_1601245, partial [Mycena galopus ATCC 62051]
LQVLRTWVTGLAAGQKDSDNIAVPDLEANGIGNYDDTVLNLIDQLMVCFTLSLCFPYKTLLEAPSTLVDVYGKTYGTEGFYTNPAAINAFNQRITHILNTHKNALLGNQPWSDLSAHIFGLEPQNDPEVAANLDWICNAAQQVIPNVPGPTFVFILVCDRSATTVQSAFFSSSCAINVVAVHDYTDGYDSYMPSAISQAQGAGKRLIIEEWGSLVGSGRTANLESNVAKINNYKVPWLYWELISNPDPHQSQDYEIQVNGADWSTLSTGAESTAALTGAPFDFSASLTL